MEQCATCKDPWDLLRWGESVAINVERHSSLYKCPECGTYYEIIPEDRGAPNELTASEVRERFPDYDLNDDA